MMRTLRRLILLGLAMAWLLPLHMVLLASAAPVIRTLSVALPGWPAGQPPLRLALLSDSHASTPGDSPALLARTVARIDALRPDAVLIAGDVKSSGTRYVRRASARAAIAPLAGLHAPLGVYLVLGNHDWPDHVPIIKLATRAGIRVLDNNAVRIGPIALIGVGDRFSHHDDLPAALAAAAGIGGVPVVLTHSPDIIPDLPDDITLALAGHTHCGQVRLPLIGALQTASIYGQRYGCGIVREGTRTSVIGAGLGVSGLPIRLGAPPDLWLITVGG